MSRTAPTPSRKNVNRRQARRVRLDLHALEERAVPALATAQFAAGILTITGGTGPDIDDNLQVDLVAGTIKIFEDGSTPISIVDEPPSGVTLAVLTGIIVNANDGNDTVTISSLIKKPATMNGGLGEDQLTGGGGNDTINGDEGVDFLFGGAGNDTINGGAGDGQVIDGQAGNDSLTGGAETDDIFGGFGDDTVNGGAGDDRIRGDDPTDRRGGKDTINGDAGDDIIVGGRGNDNLNGGTGNDVIEAGDGNDTVIGGPDDDAGPNYDADADSIYGGAGNDSINGGWGRDLMYGEAGNDTLVGGAGEDLLSGSLGIDVFIGHGNPVGVNVGDAEDLENFDTYRDEFDLTKPINGKAEVKDIAITELGIQAALAGIAAVANNQTSFNIAGRIRYLGSGEYLVKLGPDEEISPVSSGSINPFGWVPVRFDGTWTDNDPRPSAQQRLIPRRDAREFWTVLLHRAVTQSFNSTYDPFVHYTQAQYDNLDLNGGLTNAAKFIDGLTGAPPDLPIALPGGFDFSATKTNLSLGFWFTAEAGATPIAGVAANQFYAVTKVSTVLGINYITLYNASGFDKGTIPAGALDQTGRQTDDGFITLREADFLASFGTMFKN